MYSLNPILACVLCALSLNLAYAETAEEEFEAFFAENDTVTIASGKEQNINRAPATTTVITTKDIEAMGAMDLNQVLESVPGVHVSPYSTHALKPRFGFRGILTQHNPQVLVMINSLPITEAFAGDRGNGWGGMPVENIERIEVIRGPGSALYGADALSGVINIITKTAKNIKGLEFGTRLGSFNTRDAWLQHGKQWEELETMFYLRHGETDGYRGILEKDSASATGISHAPGPLSTFNRSTDARTDIAWKQLRFRAAYKARELGTGGGIANAIDYTSKLVEEHLFSDVSYTRRDLLPNLDVSAVAGFFDVNSHPSSLGYYTLFPAGAFPGYANGFLGGPSHKEKQSYANLSGFYSGIRRHEIHFGVGHRYTDLYEVKELKNFDKNFAPIPLQEAQGNPNLVYMMPATRRLSYVFVQDEWTIVPDWTLTAGIRYDKYSDFGSTTNPRLALVWDAALNVTVKAMHGNAFRAPTFAEQYTANNPVTLGDMSIKPERISTDELAVAWQIRDNLRSNFSLFRYRMRDAIVPTTPLYKNIGGQTGEGFEAETTWDASKNLRIKGNISLQRSTDSTSGKDAGVMPRTHIFARADWQFSPAWYLAPVINHVANREREPADTRPTVPNYTTVDVMLRRERIDQDWSLRMNVINLFNERAYEPSIIAQAGQSDLPLTQRAVYLQLSRAVK